MQLNDLTQKKRAASAWFSSLQSSLIDAFEKLEDDAGPLYSGITPGRFGKKPWKRGALRDASLLRMKDSKGCFTLRSREAASRRAKQLFFSSALEIEKYAESV